MKGMRYRGGGLNELLGCGLELELYLTEFPK